MIKVKVLEANTTLALDVKEISVRELLEKLNLTETEHIVLRNCCVITEEDILVDGDEVTIFTVKSGG
ncbi:MAG: MoaD/ThiS family protein [Desulfurococcaceae archaeon]